jgi:hypothetical protein
MRTLLFKQLDKGIDHFVMQGVNSQQRHARLGHEVHHLFQPRSYQVVLGKVESDPSGVSLPPGVEGVGG